MTMAMAAVRLGTNQWHESEGDDPSRHCPDRAYPSPAALATRCHILAHP
jgi:hypothetical protein